MIESRPIFYTLAIVLILSLSITMGFYAMFSNFMSYDDEGMMMLVTRLVLDGHTLYRQIEWIYGPSYLALLQLHHDWLGIPLTHSAARFLSLATWLLISATNGLLIYRLTRSLPWALSGFILIFLFIGSIVNEPGHPQGAIALTTSLALLVASNITKLNQGLSWAIIGICVGFITHMKINAGLFFFAAISLVLISQSQAARWRGFLFAACVAFSALFPFLLMWPLLNNWDAYAFAAITGLSIAAVTTCLLASEHSNTTNFRKSATAFILGFVALSLAALIYLWIYGASGVDFFNNLRHYSKLQVSSYHFFSQYSVLQFVLATASLITAFIVNFSRHTLLGNRLLLYAKIIFVLSALYSLIINDQANANAMLAYAGPWCWVLIFRNQTQQASISRLLLASVAVWSPLLAYPIPGSQLYFGSFTILLAALICAADLFNRQLVNINSWSKYAPILACIAAILLLITQLHIQRSNYIQAKPLGLPGTEYIKISHATQAFYQELTKEFNLADVAITDFRLNSLYFWSNAGMPAQIASLSPLGLSTKEHKAKIKEGLESAQRPIVVLQPTGPWAPPPSDIIDWIKLHFEPYRKINGYTLMRPIEENVIPIKPEINSAYDDSESD